MDILHVKLDILFLWWTILSLCGHVTCKGRHFMTKGEQYYISKTSQLLSIQFELLVHNIYKEQHILRGKMRRSRSNMVPNIFYFVTILENYDSNCSIQKITNF